MLKQFRFKTCISAVILMLAVSAYAKDSKPFSPAPIPSQITAATKVFIANGGADNFGAMADKDVFSGSPTRAYNEFYAAAKDWGRYQIVSTPGEADLVLEISLSFSNLKEPLETLSNSPIDLARLRLKIIDRETRTTLWAINEHVRGGVLLSNRDKNFEQAMNDLMSDLKNLAPAAGAASKN